MDILILEDSEDKFHAVSLHLKSITGEAKIDRVCVLADFLRHVERRKFDFIVVDLMVPRFKDSTEAEDVSGEIIDACRDTECTNQSTTVVALTAFNDASDGNYKRLNASNVVVLTFDPSDAWKKSLGDNLLKAKPKQAFDIVIVCALPKEVQGFIDAGYPVGSTFMEGVLDCREINIAGHKGVIVTASRMGLVTCAITATQAINYFAPKLICMSGICAGINGKANFLDVAIAEICHQHDFGKWSISGYEPEVYAVSLKPKLRTQLKLIVNDQKDFSDSILDGVSYDKEELPDDAKRLVANVYLTPASSGSAVVADEKMVEIIRDQQRKGVIFEMESFALYEAARLHPSDIPVFSAKAVVDNGTSSKGDRFHRLACVLSAKTVFECIRRLGLMEDSLLK